MTNYKLRIKLQSFDKIRLSVTVTRISAILKKNCYSFIGPITLPTKIRRYCLLRSPHVNKTSREHFEIKTYKKFLDIFSKTYYNLKFFILSGVDIQILKL